MQAETRKARTATSRYSRSSLPSRIKKPTKFGAVHNSMREIIDQKKV